MKHKKSFMQGILYYGKRIWLLQAIIKVFMKRFFVFFSSICILNNRIYCSGASGSYNGI